MIKNFNRLLFNLGLVRHKKPEGKVYDIFTFFNELSILDIRLNILDAYVDHFVIVESTETFTGRPKPLYFETNSRKFKKYREKIIHYVVRDTPKNFKDLETRLNRSDKRDLSTEIIVNTLKSDNIVPGVNHWLKEFYQKESIKKALINLHDNDICYVGDVDEIWNPEARIDYYSNDVFKLRQLVYVYYLNNRSNEKWAGTLVTKYKNIKNGCLNHLRTATKTRYHYVNNGGWHFTNQGDLKYLLEKLDATYSNDDYNTKPIITNLKSRFNANKDYIGRGYKFWLEERNLPRYLKENKIKYPKMFK